MAAAAATPAPSLNPSSTWPYLVDELPADILFGASFPIVTGLPVGPKPGAVQPVLPTRRERQ